MAASEAARVSVVILLFVYTTRWPESALLVGTGLCLELVRARSCVLWGRLSVCVSPYSPRGGRVCLEVSSLVNLSEIPSAPGNARPPKLQNFSIGKT